MKILDFSERWRGKGDEKSDTQKFWLEFLRDVSGLENPEKFIEFEKRVKLEHMGFIDAYIPSTRTLIEQKGIDQPITTAFAQAKNYSDWLPDSERARWIIVCNFKEFRIYDMQRPRQQPEIISLSSLKDEWPKFAFLTDVKAPSPKEIREEKISKEAGDLVGQLYDSLISRYENPDEKKIRHSLTVFCVRIVFLFFAESSELDKQFHKRQFYNYLKARESSPRDALQKLFEILNQKIDERDPYLEDEELKAFPYVNGGLFAEKDIEIPKLFGQPLRIIYEMSKFKWSEISPTIFGAIFESTLNPETRQSGGMHYTSIENIHKVINPLFLDELEAEFNAIISKQDHKQENLRNLQNRISKLKFFDPACGSGNFLTESYLSLRRLENKILDNLDGQISFSDIKSQTPIKVSISQFYGIEINDFAVAVARTALWIAEAQMWNETKNIFEFTGELLPLESQNGIVEANALKINWNEIVKPDYIISNPPFLGYSIQNKEQKDEIISLFKDENGKSYRASGKIDYVSGWYFKAAEMIKDTEIKAAFVSTNSITQGEQVSAIFKPLSERFKIHVDFAHTTFVWDNEAKDKAHVHVVVIGFSSANDDGKLKRLYTPEGLKLVENINFYLVDGKNIFLEARTKPICNDVPEMLVGNRAADGGNLIIEAKDYDEFIKREPKAKKFIKRYMMGDEFINGKMRYCLWLVDATPQELKNMPLVMERIKACREDRLKGAADRQKLADTPHLFRETRNPKRYLVIPKTSSENRYYIPIDWLDDSIIPGDSLRIIPNATLYDFGILTSRVHMAWTRRVCGRLEMRYSYSNIVVYNNFIWPSTDSKHREKIESTAQKILDSRALYPDSNFTALYDEITMPVELRKAHRENDDAVCEAYGWEKDISENEIVSRLFEMYTLQVMQTA
ncbi:MAG: class I SAM-dependent DNA methyltransferase [Synergistaceae bacterium]|nr:class I SAM-dependent DNA methyltransferase [Synergistaceae bacterium]